MNTLVLFIIAMAMLIPVWIMLIGGLFLFIVDAFVHMAMKMPMKRVTIWALPLRRWVLNLGCLRSPVGEQVYPFCVVKEYYDHSGDMEFAENIWEVSQMTGKGFWSFLHNAVAHPLMAFFPKSKTVMYWHDWTGDRAYRLAPDNVDWPDWMTDTVNDEKNPDRW
jgi:hypothetical protein